MPPPDSTFARIVCVDKTGLLPSGVEELKQYSRRRIICFEDAPADDAEIIRRIEGADCVLVSWDTQIREAVLRASPNLKYVGMCCSLYDDASANVDLAVARELGITVRGIRNYGDVGLVEFIFAELISLYKGLRKHQWGTEQEELTGKRLGIIGLGTTGEMVARTAACFGMHARYHSRTRKIDLETNELQYASLDALLEWADVISIHVPKRTKILDADAFARIGPRTILINTSLGPTFDIDSFQTWIDQPGNFAIMDADGVGDYRRAFATHERAILSDKVGGWTAQAKQRLTCKVLDNIREFLSDSKAQSGGQHDR